MKTLMVLCLIFVGCQKPTPAPAPTPVAPEKDSVWVVMSEDVTFMKGESLLVVVRNDSLFITEK